LLISPQEVEVKWNNSNIKHFEEKGYKFTKYNNVLKVNATDLMNGSGTKVKILCDYCLEEEGLETIFQQEYNKYIKAINKNERNCCDKCKGKKLSELKSKRVSEKFIMKLELEGYILIRNDYYKLKTITFICPEGHEWVANSQSISYNRRCKWCSYIQFGKNQLRSLEEVQKIFLDEGCKLVSTEYINNTELLDYICNCGRPAKIRLKAFMVGERCWQCFVDNRTGEKSINWNPDKDPNDRVKIRDITYYNPWRISVYKRDNYKCVCCGSNKKINAHHLNGYDWCVEGRTEINNGVVLCRDCHLKFHTIHGFGKNTLEQFIIFYEQQLNKDIRQANNLSFLFEKERQEDSAICQL